MTFDFDTKRVFYVVTDLILLLLCITMPNLAPFLAVVWNESRARPAHELWCPGPCPPRYHVQFALLPWWTTMDPPEIIGSLRGPDGQRWLIIEHRYTRWSALTRLALAAGLPTGEIPRRCITRRWWSAIRPQTSQALLPPRRAPTDVDTFKLLGSKGEPFSFTQYVAMGLLLGATLAHHHCLPISLAPARRRSQQSLP